MANISKVNLQDKDIRNLKPKDKQYRKAVGNPKELYIWINPSGIKTFFILYKGKTKKLHEFTNDYGVEQAREDAFKEKKRLKNNVPLKSNKYTLGALYEIYIRRKKLSLTKNYISRIECRMKRYILPRFGNKDIKTIKYTDLLETLTPIFNPSNPAKSGLGTIERLIGDLNAIFTIAINDGYIGFNPCNQLKNDFPSSRSFAIKHGVDTRYPAIVDENLLKEFLTDLINDNKMELQTKRAVLLQILCVNRPKNTVEARWEHIDLEKGIWSIPASEMKTGFSHIINLSNEAIKVLKEQRIYCMQDSEFVFPSFEKIKKGIKISHMNRDTINKAIKNFGGKNKYLGKATAHGFRATFKTICTLNLAELGTLGISEKTIENALAHKELDDIKFAYERQTATMEQNKALMQWYANYLNKIVKFI